MGWYITYIILGVILLPGLIYAGVVQARVQTAFKTYARVHASTGITAEMACKRVLQQAGVYDVQIRKIAGELTDNYNPTNKTLSLSQSVYGSSSISALGVACHEAGHAIQHAEGYKYLRLRSGLATLSAIGNKLLLPLIIVGLVLMVLSYTSFGGIFVIGGCVIFGFSVIFSLVTLPVEFNASKRALAALQSACVLDGTEVKGAKVVLDAAAKTYVAGLIVSVLGFLRFILSIWLTSRE